MSTKVYAASDINDADREIWRGVAYSIDHATKQAAKATGKDVNDILAYEDGSDEDEE